jgi:hypothetical protein
MDRSRTQPPAVSRRAVLLVGGGLAAYRPGRGHAQGGAMIHVVLLGDSIFDNASYVSGGPDVRRQVKEVLPPDGKVTLLARDGAVIDDVTHQLRGLPSDATHLIISAGGNDALRQSGILESSARSVAEALTKLAAVGESFARAYDSMLQAAGQARLNTAACTIYEPRFADPLQRTVAAAGLTLLNDRITRQVFARGLNLIDLRVVCDEAGDFANPIEPSVQGGGKIARAISRFATGLPPRSSVFC